MRISMPIRRPMRSSGCGDVMRRSVLLKTMPTRCGTIREQAEFDHPYREMLYQSHRIIFTIDEPNAVVKIVELRRLRSGLGLLP